MSEIKVRKFNQWEKSECDSCHNEFQVTRCDPKEVVGDLHCSKCIEEIQVEELIQGRDRIIESRDKAIAQLKENQRIAIQVLKEIANNGKLDKLDMAELAFDALLKMNKGDNDE